MNEILLGFTSRDAALLVWIAIFFVFALTKKDIRTSLMNLLLVLRNKYVLIIFSLMLIYVFIALVIIDHLNLWRLSLTRDAVLWVIGFGGTSIININKARKDQNYLKGLIKNSLKLTLLIEFLVNFYNFPFIVELIFLPILFLLFGVNVYSKNDKKYEVVQKSTYYLISCLGLCLLLYIGVEILTSSELLFSIDNLVSLMLPIYLSLAFTPFLYFLSLFVLYQEIIVLAKYLLREEKGLGEYFEKQILVKYKLNLSRLLKFNNQKRRFLINSKTKKDIDKLLIIN